jgi:hypothetical protein
MKNLTLIFCLVLLSGCTSNNSEQIEDSSNGIYAPKGELFIQPQFESVSEFSNGMASYSTRASDAPLFTGGGNTGKPLELALGDNLNGYISSEGKILPPIYTAAYEFSNGVSAVAQAKNKFGVIDKSGKWIVQPEYNFISGFNSGLSPFQKNENEKYGYMNLKGEIVIEPKFDSAGWFYEERALVCEEHKNYDDSTCGFINLKGEYITDKIFSQYHSHWFSEGLAMVCTGKNENLLCGYIDKNGTQVLKLGNWTYQNKYGEYTSMLGDFSQGLALVGGRWFDGNIQKWGFFNKNFEYQIPEILTAPLTKFAFEPYEFTGNLQWQTVGTSKDSIGQTAAMNKQGEIKFFSTYEEVRAFYQGLSAVKVNGKWGYVNEKNEIVIEPIYDEARDFSEGFAAVRLNKKWGFVN